jgi:hypothetical protein
VGNENGAHKPLLRTLLELFVDVHMVSPLKRVDPEAIVTATSADDNILTLEPGGIAGMAFRGQSGGHLVLLPP